MDQSKIKYTFGTMDSPGVAPSFKRKQAHGTNSIELLNEQQECGEADAFWTRRKGLVVSVNTADCVPILLHRSDFSSVAAIHAGWRGTLANIVEAFFHLQEPRDWVALIGPSIRKCCYSVSAELISDFKKKYPAIPETEIEPSSQRLDLLAVNSFQLERLGVKIEKVHPDCTFCTKNEEGSFKYFSYRRGDRFSRQYSSISIS